MATEFMERVTHVIIDELGIDPLRDRSWQAIRDITDYSEYVVTQTEENNIPLISHKMYGDMRLWWIIQVYNGIADPFTVKSGTVLRIPAYNSISSTLVDLQIETTSISSVEI